MDRNTAHQVRVGAFVTVGLIALIGMILSLGGNRSFFIRYVPLKIQLKQVQGLNEGSVISVAGMTVGNVSKIEYSKDKGKMVVTFDVRSEALAQITKSSIGEIRTQGALGDRFIYITPGNPEDPPLQAGEFMTANEGSDILDLLSEKGGNVGKVFDIISQVHEFSRAISADGRPEKIMSNLAEASESLKHAARDGQALIAELRGKPSKQAQDAIAKLDSILTKIDRGEGTLGALINDPSVHSRLKSMLGNSSNTKDQMKMLIRTSIDTKD